jgi:hypothetical protein
MQFVEAMRQQDITATLYVNDKLRRIMGFGLDCGGEHFQGHEVGIPWGQIRERLILSEGMQKMDTPQAVISFNQDGEVAEKRCSREEALRAARERAPELFESIQMEEDDNNCALFTDGDSDTPLFYEHPEGDRVTLNRMTFTAVAAALVYGRERWNGPVYVECKDDPESARLFLAAADRFDIEIFNRAELERLVPDYQQPAKVSHAQVDEDSHFSEFAKTLEKLVEYESFAELGDNQKIKQGLRSELDELLAKGLGPVDNAEVQSLIERLSNQIAYPEQAEAVERYLNDAGFNYEVDTPEKHRLYMS